MAITLEEVQTEIREPRANEEPNWLQDYLYVIETREEPLELAANWLRKLETQDYFRKQFPNQVVMVYREKVVGSGEDLGLARDSASKEGFDPDDCWPYFVEDPLSIR